MKRIISTVCAAALLTTAVVMTPVTSAELPLLKADSRLIMSRDGSTVCGTAGSITADDLAAEFDGEVTVKDPTGAVITDTKKVPTGSTVEGEGGSVSVLISGDANADGNVNLSDVASMLKKIAMWDVTMNETAADVDNTGKANLADVAVILKYIAKWDVRLGNMKVTVNEEPVKAAAEDSGMDMWFDHATEKLEQSDTTSTDDATYVIYAAKNEIEDAVMYVSPDKDYKDLKITVTDFVNCYGDTVTAEAFSFHYTPMGEYGYRPDALMPTESTFKTAVKADKSQGYLVKAKTTAETEAGLYEATVSLTSDGAEVKRAKVYLNVWNFTLDDRDACDTAFGMGRYGVLTGHGADGSTTQEEADRIYEIYYDFLLENRVNAFTLPYDINTEKGQEYMSDPRVHAFVIAGKGYDGGMDRTDEQIAEYYDILTSNPEWLEKGYFYYLDEPLPDDRLPNNKNAYYSIGSEYEEIQRQFPGGWQMIPLETCHGYNLTNDFYTVTKGTVQVYCPKTYAFTPEKYRGIDGAQVFLEPTDTAKYGTFEEVIDSWVADGTIKKLWWYFSCSTVDPYPNYNAESEGILPRVSGWQQYMYDVEGILYYAVQEYSTGNPYRNIRYQTTNIYGDGILIYPGPTFDVDGPIGSIRLEYIRDGIEDYMYLTMAERVLGEEKTDEIIHKVTKDMLDYTLDTDILLAARAELAEAIMAAE